MCSSVVGSTCLYSPGFISRSVSTKRSLHTCMFQLGLYINVHVQGYIQSYCVHYILAHEHNGTHGEEVALMWRMYGQGPYSVDLLFVIH